jgi:hypothetical protein
MTSGSVAGPRSAITAALPVRTFKPSVTWATRRRYACDFRRVNELAGFPRGKLRVDQSRRIARIRAAIRSGTSLAVRPVGVEDTMNTRSQLGNLLSVLAVTATVGCAAADPDADDGDGLDFATQAAIEPPPAASAPSAGSVTFARDVSEQVNGVRIRTQQHEKPTVVYSVRLPDPSSTEQLRVRGEVMISRCNGNDIEGGSKDGNTTPCVSKAMRQNPYAYNPRYSAAFVLGSSSKDASGPRVSNWVDTVCTERQHHCALAVPEATVTDLPNDANLHLNLVVTADANGSTAQKWHVMDVEQGRGGLFVTRLGAGHTGERAFEKSSTQLLSTGGMGIDRPSEDGDKKRSRWLLHQVKLDGLQAGDVVDADARMRALLGGYDCDPLVMSEIILTSDKNAREVEGAHDVALTAKNGRNCTNHAKKGCLYKKSGAARLKKGTPPTMYLSYVATALRSCAAANGSNKWRADPSDGLLKGGVRR